MYCLEVYFPSETHPRHVERLDSAAEVLERVAALLREHAGCEKVVVLMGASRLFAVDCRGNTVQG